MKLRIKLIVTGDVELEALTDSLRRWFPEKINKTDVEWLPAEKPGGGTTTYRFKQAVTVTSPMATLARRMVAEAWIGRDGCPADLIIAVDDLELANQDQPALVIDHFKAAVHSEIIRHNLSEKESIELRTRLRERCSFHLLNPMIEAYFFGERDALTRAGIAPDRTPYLCGSDLEDFETNDPAWLPTCTEENVLRAVIAPWWRHQRHPKHYLVHLSPQDAPYAERSDGIAALAQLDWPRVPAHSTATPFIRALFEDLAEWFGVDNPLGHGACAPETSPVHLKDRRNLVLRNL